MIQGLISNISIKYKILFIILLPLCAMLFISGDKILELKQYSASQNQLVKLMSISVAASNLVHEMQKERGASAGFTSSQGRNFSDTLPKQRKLTNAKYEVLTEAIAKVDLSQFDQDYNASLKEALNDYAKIDSVRKKVDAFRIPLAEVVKYYTSMNARFLGISNTAIFSSQDPDIIRDVSAYVNFLQSKERAGIERAIGAAGFSSGWHPKRVSQFNNLITIQNTYLDVFKTFATGEELRFYKEQIKDPSFAEVQRMRDVALSSLSSSRQTVDPGVWFKTITKKINVLKNIEDFIAADVMHVAHEHAKKASQLRNLHIAISATLIILITLISIVIMKDLLGSIRNTKLIMQDLAEGNTDNEVQGIDRKDEIGSMARSVEVFKQNLLEKKAMKAQVLEAEKKAEQKQQQAMSDMADDFDSQIGGLISSLSCASTDLQSTAEAMRCIADETSQSSSIVASSSEEASTNVSTVASAMEEMSASSSEIASQITSAKHKSNDTATSAKSANETVGNLNELVCNIGEVVVAIKDIAEQTNLLALNATIEAARAGEAGKGFAVVADEVKKLASETATKTEEIENRITEIQGATEASVEAMERIISNISDIDLSVTGVSAAVEEQNATTSEIVRSVSEASQGVQQVTQIISEVQRGAGETGSSADTVLDAASKVSDLSSTLQSSVSQFLDTIRSDSAKDAA